MKKANSVLSSYGTTVFEVMSRLALEHHTINLGQGFPDDTGPQDVLEAAASAVVEKPNQYPPMLGIPELRQAVAAHNRRFYDLAVDWEREVMVTSGATEALSAALFGLIEPADEVVLIEPLYDSYLPIVRRAGGVARLVRVSPPDWVLPERELEQAFSPRTKLILLNTPMNPSGKVFSSDELDLIASLVKRYDAYAVCDEVYEHIIFDGRRHQPLMLKPGMRERAVRIGSAGKTFSLTGWKVGYVTAPPNLLGPISKCHQFLVFTTPPNLQHAVAYGLGKDDAYFTGLAHGMQAKRDRLAQALAAVGFDILPCEGTYFLNAGFRRLGFRGDDESFCRHMTLKAGVTAIPLSAFYQEGDVRGYVRFCFAKQDAVLDAAAARLGGHFSSGGGDDTLGTEAVAEEDAAGATEVTPTGRQIRRMANRLPWVKRRGGASEPSRGPA
ncbi:MAG: aminotransferase [Alphaproteobacteria bacterium]